MILNSFFLLHQQASDGQEADGKERTPVLIQLFMMENYEKSEKILFRRPRHLLIFNCLTSVRTLNSIALDECYGMVKSYLVITWSEPQTRNMICSQWKPSGVIRVYTSWESNLWFWILKLRSCIFPWHFGHIQEKKEARKLKKSCSYLYNQDRSRTNVKSLAMKFYIQIIRYFSVGAMWITA